MRGWHERWPGARRAVRPPHAQIHTHAYLAQRFLLAVELADELHALVLENRERFLVDPQRRAARDPPQLRRPPGFHLHYCRADVFESSSNLDSAAASPSLSISPLIASAEASREVVAEGPSARAAGASSARGGPRALPLDSPGGAARAPLARARRPPAFALRAGKRTPRLKLVEIAGRRGRAGPARARARAARGARRAAAAPPARTVPRSAAGTRQLTMPRAIDWSVLFTGLCGRRVAARLPAAMPPKARLEREESEQSAKRARKSVERLSSSKLQAKQYSPLALAGLDKGARPHDAQQAEDAVRHMPASRGAASLALCNTCA